jgi:hypothetical protein
LNRDVLYIVLAIVKAWKGVLYEKCSMRTVVERTIQHETKLSTVLHTLLTILLIQHGTPVL